MTCDTHACTQLSVLMTERARGSSNRLAICRHANGRHAGRVPWCPVRKQLHFPQQPGAAVARAE